VVAVTHSGRSLGGYGVYVLLVERVLYLLYLRVLYLLRVPMVPHLLRVCLGSASLGTCLLPSLCPFASSSELV